MPVDEEAPLHGATVAPMPYPGPVADPGFGSLLRDLEVRLRPVLADMAPESFTLLVRDIAAVKLRWAAEARAPGRTSAASDRISTPGSSD